MASILDKVDVLDAGDKIILSSEDEATSNPATSSGEGVP